MRSTSSLVTAPIAEPITLEVAKAHLRIGDDEDELINGWIAAARQWAQDFTGRQLMYAVWDVSLDRWPCEVAHLPHAPLQSVVSVKYLDAAGDEQTLASSVYRVKAFAGETCRPGRFSLEYGQTWPIARGVDAPITIRIGAGYPTSGDTAAAARAKIPMALRQAMLLVIGECDRRRSLALQGTIIGEVPLSARNLAAPFRVYPTGL